MSALVTLAGSESRNEHRGLLPSTSSCREMVPDPAFLTALNAPDETPGTVSYAHVVVAVR